MNLGIMRSMVYKLGGIGCFILLAWLLYTSKPNTIQGWVMMLALVIFLGSLGVVGIFGARLGTIPYRMAGYILLGLAGLFFVFFLYSLGVGEIEYTSPMVGFLSIVFICLVIFAAGIALIDKASKLKMSGYLLRFWKTDVVLTIEGVQEILRECLGEKATGEQVAEKAEDALRLLLEQGHIKRVTPTSWKRIPK